MKSNSVVYLLIVIGCVLLILIWSWALSGGTRLIEITAATAATVVLSVGSSVIATKKIKDDLYHSLGEVASETMIIAVAVGIIGVCVLVFEHVPSRSGGSSHLDRRYALLFFAVAAYLLLFPFLSSRQRK